MTSASVVRGLADQGLLRPVALSEEDPVEQPDPARAGAVLSDAQAAAAGTLVDSIGAGFSVTLLDGVTGSGKTEVYFEAIAAALAAKKQVAVLLPEIALTADWLGRFEQRFGAPPVVWHSDLPASQRRRNWRAVLHGEARLVVGARSALMLPFPDLGLIVIDEEHDPSFKQEEGVIYNARDMAVVRAHIGEFPVILATMSGAVGMRDCRCPNALPVPDCRKSLRSTCGPRKSTGRAGCRRRCARQSPKRSPPANRPCCF